MMRTVLLVGAVLLAVVGCAGSGTGDTSSSSSPATRSPGTPPPTDPTIPPPADATTPPDATTPADATTPPAADPTNPPPVETATPSRPMSTTVLPTLTRPTAPPKEPSDQLTGLWVVGSVTTGGEGPCYTVTSDDGQVYQLSGPGGTLTAGDRIKVRIVQPPQPVYCGDTEALTLLEVAPGSW